MLEYEARIEKLVTTLKAVNDKAERYEKQAKQFAAISTYRSDALAQTEKELGALRRKAEMLDEALTRGVRNAKLLAAGALFVGFACGMLI